MNRFLLGLVFITALVVSTGRYGIKAASEHKVEKEVAELRNQLNSSKGVDRKSLILRAHILWQLFEWSDLNQAPNLKYLEEGQALAKQVLKERPDDPQALFLWASHKGMLAGLKKNLSSLLAISDLVETFEKLESVQPGYEKGAAHRGLGAIYLHAPRWISVGSMKKAKQHLLSAYKQDAQYPPNQLAWAEYLIESEQTGEAKKILQESIENSKRHPHALERQVWQNKAAELMERLGGSGE